MRFGGWEIALSLILVMILIIFGVGKLPQVYSFIGKAMLSFRKRQTGDEEKTKQDTLVSQNDSEDNQAKKN